MRSPAKCYKDTLCNETSTHLHTSAVQAATLERGLWAGRLGSWAVGGKECSRAQRETLTATARFSPERKINIPESITGIFFFQCVFQLCETRLRVTPGRREREKKKLMPNFFICVLLPRVVPPNQYAIHKYPRAPCSRQSGDESLRVSLLHTSWLPEGGKTIFKLGYTPDDLTH